MAPTASIQAHAQPLLASKAHGMDLPTSVSPLPHPTKPADVPGGCAGAPEPIRGCDRVCAPTKVLTQVHLRTTSRRPRARRRAGTGARCVRPHAGVKICGGQPTISVTNNRTAWPSNHWHLWRPRT